MTHPGWARWLQRLPLSGWVALLCGIAAVALPTLVRAAIDGVVTGCEFTPYLPFVLISAILLRWWQAGLVALGSAAVLGGLFASPADHPMNSACFLSGAGIFLAASAGMIGTVMLIRHAIATMQNRAADELADGVIFSLEKGEVWASWHGQGAPVRLGKQRRVAEMMKDFLAQVELGKRFAKRFPPKS